MVIPITQVNALYGHTYGTEIALNYQMSPWWKLSASYTLLKLDLRSHVDSSEPDDRERGSPENQFQMHSFLTLPWNMEFDTALYYVDHLGSRDIPSYVRLDARIGWQPTSGMRISLALQNLLDNRHPEYKTQVMGLQHSEVPRSIYLKTTWLF
jgi:iron complex outermembrane receptor protein